MPTLLGLLAWGLLIVGGVGLVSTGGSLWERQWGPALMTAAASVGLWTVALLVLRLAELAALLESR